MDLDENSLHLSMHIPLEVYITIVIIHCVYSSCPNLVQVAVHLYDRFKTLCPSHVEVNNPQPERLFEATNYCRVVKKWNYDSACKYATYLTQP